MSHLDKVIGVALGLTDDELKLRRQAIQRTKEESMSTAPGQPKTLGEWRARAIEAEGKVADVQSALSVWRLHDPEECIRLIGIIVGYYIAESSHGVHVGGSTTVERQPKGGEA